MTAVGDVRTIPISAITVLNARTRSKQGFQDLVKSIGRLGLKKPITVAVRAETGGYDLVCGQGRLEACVALGATEIPAVVIEASPEDCFVMSLVENLARRQPSPVELLRNVGELRGRGYTLAEIAEKTDFSVDYVHAICFLLEHGEQRLLAAVDQGIIPPAVAMEIARAKDADIQLALVEAYERKELPGPQVVAIRRIIEQRLSCGKRLTTSGPPGASATTGKALVRAYQRETDRHRLFIKKAAIAQSRLMFVVKALRVLFADETFVARLQTAGLSSLPKTLADRLRAEQERH